jgi:hypothetical protein
VKVTAVLASGLWVLVLAGCGNTPSERVVLPPKDAPASLVLETYLHALQAGDCSSAHALAAPTFTVSNGDLCGAVEVKDFVVHDPPAQVAPDEVEYGTELTTGGSHDGSVPSGRTAWFYSLKRQDGQWKLASGGSGP